MLKIKTLVFNPFQENTYILYDETNEAVIIDPGCHAKYEEEKLDFFIKNKNLRPVKLLNTHGHIDHIAGNYFVKHKYNIPLEAHESDEFLMIDAKKIGASYGFIIHEETPIIDNYLTEKDQIKFGNTVLDILHVPGHSPGSIVFYNTDAKILIAGDVLFHNSIGRTDLPGGSYDLLISGIKEKIFPLDKDITVYPGHGIPTTIDNEIKNNPFLS